MKGVDQEIELAVFNLLRNSETSDYWTYKGNNTVVHRKGDTIEMFYHKKKIATYDVATSTLYLCIGGRNELTTAKRLNVFVNTCNRRFKVRRERGLITLFTPKAEIPLSTSLWAINVCGTAINETENKSYIP